MNENLHENKSAPHDVEENKNSESKVYINPVRHSAIRLAVICFTILAIAGVITFSTVQILPEVILSGAQRTMLHVLHGPIDITGIKKSRDLGYLNAILWGIVISITPFIVVTLGLTLLGGLDIFFNSVCRTIFGISPIDFSYIFDNVHKSWNDFTKLHSDNLKATFKYLENVFAIILLKLPRKICDIFRDCLEQIINCTKDLISNIEIAAGSFLYTLTNITARFSAIVIDVFSTIMSSAMIIGNTVGKYLLLIGGMILLSLAYIIVYLAGTSLELAQNILNNLCLVISLILAAIGDVLRFIIYGFPYLIAKVNGSAYERYVSQPSMVTRLIDNLPIIGSNVKTVNSFIFINAAQRLQTLESRIVTALQTLYSEFTDSELSTTLTVGFNDNSGKSHIGRKNFPKSDTEKTLNIKVKASRLLDRSSSEPKPASVQSVSKDNSGTLSSSGSIKTPASVHSDSSNLGVNGQSSDSEVNGAPMPNDSRVNGQSSDLGVNGQSSDLGVNGQSSDSGINGQSSDLGVNGQSSDSGINGANSDSEGKQFLKFPEKLSKSHFK